LNKHGRVVIGRRLYANFRDAVARLVTDADALFDEHSETALACSVAQFQTQQML
jgi:hypothetical protein